MCDVYEVGVKHLLLLRPSDPVDFFYRYYKSLVQESVPIRTILDMVSELPLDAVDIFCLYMSRLLSFLRDNPIYMEGICNASSYYILSKGLMDESGRLLVSRTILQKIVPLCMVQGVQGGSFSLFLAKLRIAFVIGKVLLLLYGVLQSQAVEGRVPESVISVLSHYIPIAQSFSLSFLPPSSLDIDAELQELRTKDAGKDRTIEDAMEALVRLTLRTDSLLVHCDTDDRFEKTDLQLIHISSDFWLMA